MALKESPDYELHRLTTQTPAFFDETVKRHVQALEKELALLEREATELAKEREIDHLPGTVGMGIEYDRSALPRAASRATFRRWIRRLAGSND